MEKDYKQIIQHGRDFMKCFLEDPDFVSDQDKKLPQPPLTKAPVSEVRYALPTNYEDLKIENDFLKIINTRESHRVYTDQKMSLLELSYLLWCTQGIKEIRGKAYATLRTVPCGGARHQFETYLAIRNIEGLEPGFYHYLPMTHELEFLGTSDDLNNFITVSTWGQAWAEKANVVFYWSCVAYRVEWRYGIHAHRGGLIDMGYVSENLYLACTSIGLGGCAIGAVDPDLANGTFGLDGNDEFMVLCHPVGTVSHKDQQAEKDFYAFVKEQGL